MKNYDQSFFDYTTLISKESAIQIVPIIKKLIPEIKSVVDFGCAQGAWLETWQENGIEDIQGIDGSYFDLSKLKIPARNFKLKDLNKAINLNRRFDFAYSLEVAEHLKPQSSVDFIRSLTRHAPIVLFSASPPGQGGETHINERSFDYWRNIFEKYNYQAFDCIRPLIATNQNIAFWYRFNTILYVHKDSQTTLSKLINDTKIENNEKIKDISPLWFKFRKFVILLIPFFIQNKLARIKSRLLSLKKK